VPREDLTPEQQQQLPTGCCGAYISPLKLEDTELPTAQRPIEAKARRSRVDGAGTITFEGDVTLGQGVRQLKADRASANRQNRELTLDGNVEVREEGLLIRADSARMNLDTRDATVD